MNDIIKSVVLLLCSCVLVLTGCGQHASSYDVKAVVREREDKDEFFGKHYQSPLDDVQKQHFKGLRYFAPNPRYAIQARVERFAKPDTTNIKANDASNLRMIKWGVIHWSIDGASYSLLALKPMKEDEDIRALALHVYFADATNDDITYDAGRYVYIPFTREPQTGDTVILDFNRSFNPFCAYNASYVCPLVPVENRLPIRIEAGEQRFKH